MTKIDVDAVSVTQVRAPARVEADLQEIVVSIPRVVLSLDATAIASQLRDE